MPTLRSTGSTPEADVLRTIYAELTAYLGVLRDARSATNTADVRVLIDELIDEALVTERKILVATQRAGGRTLQDGY
jgi:hypothetical protein